MIELRIDNRPVAIDDISIELVAYNPLADESADHTLDIDIDLSHPANAAALGHIGRLDRDISAAWGESRAGELLDNGRTIVSGRAYLLSIADHRAKIQIVANRTAARYTEDDEEAEDAFAMGGARIDRWLSYRTMPADTPQVHTASSWNYYMELPNGRGLPSIKHPRLVDTLEAFFDAADYTVIHDCLRQSDYAMSVCIVSNSQSETWGDHLPPWSIAYLVRQVERMFNVQVLIDEPARTVRIESLTMSASGVLDIEPFDDWELEIEEEGEGLNVYDNVRYDLPDGQYYAEADLHDGQEEAFDHAPAEHGTPAQSGSRTLWDDTLPDGTVLGSYVVYGAEAGFDGYAAPVNNYRHIGSYDADNTIELAIVPAEHTCAYNVSTSHPSTEPVYWNAPVGCDYDKPDVEEDQTNYEIITDGRAASQADNGQQMRVAAFHPSIASLEQGWAMRVPFSICSIWGAGENMMYPQPGRNGVQQTDTLSLPNLAREFHWAYNMEALRSRHLYKVRAVFPWTRDLQTYKARVRGKLYVIRSVKHTLTARGFDPVAEIEMYPIDD